MFDLLYIVIVIGVILISMTIHEVMHGLVAYRLGDDTAKLQGRLTLNPIRHIDPFLTIILPVMLAIFQMPIFGGAKPVPFNPSRVRGGEWGSALVAVAGPLVNFFLAFVSLGLLIGLSISPNSVVGLILQTATVVNLGFFVFNMLPIPPLDGSRVMYALAPDFIRRGMEFIERQGVMIVFILILLFSSYIGRFMGTAIGFILDLFYMFFGIS